MIVDEKLNEEEHSYDEVLAEPKLCDQDDIEGHNGHEYKHLITSDLLETTGEFLKENESLKGNEIRDVKASKLEFRNRELWWQKIVFIVFENWTKDDPAVIPCSCFPHNICCKVLRLDVDRLCFDPEAPSLLFESQVMVKLIKFFSITLVFIVLTHKFVREMNFEHDQGYRLSDFFRYDFHSVILDMIVYFFIGRLFLRRGVDRLYPCLIPMMIGCIFSSCVSELKIFQYHVSMFEIMCHWPFQLFVVYLVGLILIFLLLIFHVKEFYRRGILLSRAVEVFIILAVFLLPNATDRSFHFHHWYIAWLLGMFANANTSWSLATICFAWGYYINGVAVYGRDPVMGCAYSLYLSVGNGCDYIQCFFNTTDVDDIRERFVPPDWRECKEGYFIND